MSAPTTPRPEWLTDDGLIDVTRIGCPCCGDLPWCPQERARVALESARAPELLIGTASYSTGRGRVR